MDREFILAQMKQSELYALWWIAAASNGTAAQRMISQDGVYLTKEQLEKDAMDTAKRHIQTHAALSEKLLGA